MGFEDDFKDEISRLAKEQFEGTIVIPEGLTEDEAVASAIARYEAQTGVELPEDEVRAEVRKKMAGRDTT